jgi:hypothetical protein
MSLDMLFYPPMNAVIPPALSSKLGEMFGADLRSLAVVRMGMALLILYDVLQRLRDLVAHYTDQGMISRAVAISENSSRWFVSLHFISGLWQVQFVLFLAAGVLALALLVGYKTRLVTVLSWLMLCSIHSRTPLVNGGGDVMLRVFLFWCMFLPWGARYSIDSLSIASREKWPQTITSLGTVAFITQLFYLYWFSVILKTGPEWRVDGTAIYYALNIGYMATDLAKVFLQFPLLLKLMTYGVLGLEAIGPLLLVFPYFSGLLRIVTICALSLFHFGILLTLRIGTFPVMNVVALMFFLPSSFWAALTRALKVQESSPIRIYFDADCRFCQRSVQLIKWLGQIPDSAIVAVNNHADIEAATKPHNSWMVELRGERYFDYEGLLVIAKLSPPLQRLVPLLGIHFVKCLGQKLYRYISTHRKIACETNSLTTTNVGFKLSPLTNVTIICLLLYVLLWNIGTVRGSSFKLSTQARSLGYFLRLDQHWALFAPYPPKLHGWFVIAGKLQNGQTVDLLTQQAVHWKAPRLISKTFKNHHWRRLMQGMRGRASMFPHYAAYLCRNWNQDHARSEKLIDLEIVYLSKKTQPNYEYSPVDKVLLHKHSCSGEKVPLAPVQKAPAQEEDNL